MRKISFFICAIALALFSLIACNFQNKKSDKNASSNAEVPSESKANQIIAYTNKVVDLCNGYKDYLKRTDDYLTKCAKAFKNPSDRFAFIGMITPFDMPQIQRGDGISVDKPTSALDKDEQEFFKLHCTDIQKFKGSIKKRIDSLQSYINAQDYKDDKCAKGIALIKAAYADYDTVQSLRHILYDKIDLIAEESEKVVLAKDPLKDNYLAMKEDMKAAENLSTFLDANFDNINKVMPQVDELYKKLEVNNTAHKDINASKLNDAGNSAKKSSYERFYKNFDELLGDARKTIRNAKDNGKISDSDLHSLVSDNESLVSAYNSFAN